MSVLFEESPADAAREEEPDWAPIIAGAHLPVRTWFKLASMVERLTAFNSPE